MAAQTPSHAVQGTERAVESGDTVLADAAQAGVDASKTGQKRKQTCRFFNTKSGCKAGNECKFVHVTSTTQPVEEERKPKPSKATNNRPPKPSRQYEAPAVDSSKLVARPVPKVEREDPREFQVGQIRRRFSPTEEQDGTLFKFQLQPSDPDFPFDLPFLDCELRVPLNFPSQKPGLRITNKEMPRGFQLNVEKGFDQLVLEAPNATLLGLFNRLDKQLETLLSTEKAETVKISIVRNQAQPQRRVEARKEIPQQRQQTTKPHMPPVVTFTSEQKAQAQQKRQADVRQLVARLGRLPGFNQSSDGVTFTLPFQPLKKAALPIALQTQRFIRLIVPELYNLSTHPARLEVVGNSDPSARALEQSFLERAKNELGSTLLVHINYLTSHAHTMATHVAPAPATIVSEAPVEAKPSDIVVPVPSKVPTTDSSQEFDDSHIHVIPRPPEWDVNEHDDWSSDDSYSYDSGDETDDESAEDDNTPSNAPTTGLAERGIMVSFPNLELYGCELLELVSLNLTVKCERCKDLLDVQRLRNNEKGDASGIRDEVCKKCASPLAIGYRADLLHQNSVRCGYLDLDGCTVVDMLPSNFIPTCAECSTPYPAPGVVGVRGDSVLAICRECHRKISFRIPEIRFLQVSAAAVRASRAPVRRKIKENLGIVAGTELPRRGRCVHYGKSHRWFRFSCCSKVYPCDKCHDEKESHPNEHANRQICGYCSRESNYNPTQCNICRAFLVGKPQSGFWEGGKGTRDKTRMSRKDPRKYKRRPGTKPSGGS